MTFTSMCLLLAAGFSLTIAGPVPRHDRSQSFARYLNTSSEVSSMTGLVPTYSSILDPHSTFSADSDLSVHAKTALIVQPIQKSVFTSTSPAITFQDPDGRDAATQDPQTVLFTTYITPTPLPAPQDSLSASPSSTPTSASETTSAKGNTSLPSGTGLLEASSSSMAAAENTTGSKTSQRIPSFTYSPEEGTMVSSVITTAIPTSETLASSSGGLPSDTPPISQSGADNTSKASLITSQHTTAYPSLQPAMPTQEQPSRPAEQSNIASVVVSACSSTIAALSTGSQREGPPMVIITQYTTVTPTPGLEPTNAPGLSGSPPIAQPVLSTTTTSVVFPGSSTSLAPDPVPSSSTATPQPQLAIPSQAPNYAPLPSASESIALPLPPATTQCAPAPSTALPVPPPVSVSSSTSEGPLIITPIPPSQIFTVTVTATTTDTVRETTTVTVTA